MKLVDYSHDTIKLVQNTVKEIRNSEKLIDPFFIAEKNNVDVHIISTEGVPAFSIPALDGPYTYHTFISDSVDKYSVRILLYHELGHILCEGKAGKKEVYLFDHTIDHESEFLANYFAAGFLPIFSRISLTKSTKIEDINFYVHSLIIPATESRIITLM